MLQEVEAIDSPHTKACSCTVLPGSAPGAVPSSANLPAADFFFFNFLSHWCYCFLRRDCYLHRRKWRGNWSPVAHAEIAHFSFQEPGLS